MTGILFGTGIGPGDPELMTLKAVRLIRENDTIAVPGEKPEESIAYQIAVQAVPELAEKELVAIPMPMTKNAKELEENHRRGAEKIEELLDAGKNVVFLTLGDPTVYSTYLYVYRRVLEDGYDARIVSGVTSFCAAAASLSEGLVENSEELHVIPASYQIEDALELPGGDGRKLRHGYGTEVFQRGRNPGPGKLLFTDYCKRKEEKIDGTFYWSGPWSPGSDYGKRTEAAW